MAVTAEEEEGEEADAMAIVAEGAVATVAEEVGANVVVLLIHVELGSFQVADTVAVEEEVLEDTPAASATTISSTEVRFDLVRVQLRSY